MVISIVYSLVMNFLIVV